MDVMETYILEAHIDALNANTRALEEHTVALYEHSAALNNQAEAISKVEELLKKLTTDNSNDRNITIVEAIDRVGRIAKMFCDATDKFDHAAKRIEGSNSYRR